MFSFPFTKIAIVTGLDVESFVLPATVTEVVAVISPFVGAVILRVGGTVSTLNVLVTVVASFPSLSLAVIVIVCDPSESADVGVPVH